VPPSSANARASCSPCSAAPAAGLPGSLVADPADLHPCNRPWTWPGALAKAT
jgi:hypothetical protein